MAKGRAGKTGLEEIEDGGLNPSKFREGSSETREGGEGGISFAKADGRD